MGVGYLLIPTLDEQGAVDVIAKYLVRVLNWTLVDDIANSGTDRDVVLSSPGERSAKNNHTLYVRLRGNSDNIYLTTYQTYTNSVTFTGAVSDATYGLIKCTGENKCMVVADLERVFIHIDHADGSKYYGYAGRIDSYTDWTKHIYPNLIKGMETTSYGFLYDDNPRSMFMLRSDGTKSPYYPCLIVNEDTLTAGGISARNGQMPGFKIPVVYKDNASFYEVAGELRGVYWVPGTVSSHGDFITLQGRTYVVVQSSASSDAFAIGPIAPGTIPPAIPPGVDLYSSF